MNVVNIHKILLLGDILISKRDGYQLISQNALIILQKSCCFHLFHFLKFHLSRPPSAILGSLAVNFDFEGGASLHRLDPQKYFRFKWILKHLRHLLCTLQTPSLYLADSNQTPSRHPLIPKHLPFRSKTIWVRINFETLRRHLLCTLQTPSIPRRCPSDTVQTPFGHPPHTPETSPKF